LELCDSALSNPFRSCRVADKEEVAVVGLVLVSHSEDIAKGLAELAGQMAGPDVQIEAAGAPDGTLGTDDGRVRDAIRRANSGEGVVVIGDLGSAILTVRHVLERNGNGVVRLADAPFVEGAVAAAVVSSVGADIEAVVKAAEDARGANKL
jgi:PTS hybrid protein